jgi:molybdenum cofactor biosynthesis protein B
MSEVPELHKSSAPKSAGIYIITCSTSKFKELKSGLKPNDASGDIIQRLALEAGNRVEGRLLISDSKVMIVKTLRKALKDGRVDAVIITGGTGMSPTDVTPESVAPMIAKQIPGFGELFRKISYESIGPPAMLSRAFAGTSKGKAIFCLPGSPDAVQTAIQKLILPELTHIISIAHEH